MCPVHRPVVDGERYITTWSDGDRLDAVLVKDDHAFLELTDSENRRLRLVDDHRRRYKAATDTVIGEGERPGRHVGPCEFPRACTPREGSQLFGDGGERG